MKSVPSTLWATGAGALRLLNDQPPMIFEDGEQKRDFVHVLDVANAFATVLESDLAVWEACNVGSGQARTVNEIAMTLARLLRKNIAPTILNQYRVGDIRHCFADTGKLERLFGIRPQQDFEAGMAQLIEWVQTVNRPKDRSQQSLAELTRSKLVV